MIIVDWVSTAIAQVSMLFLHDRGVGKYEYLNKLWPMTLHIPARAGLTAKYVWTDILVVWNYLTLIVKCSNNIADAAQQLRRGDKKRAQGVLDWSVDESCRKEQNKAVIKHWLEAYKQTHINIWYNS